MPIEGEYAPGHWDWVNDQVEIYERTGGQEGNTLGDTGIPVVIVSCYGRTSGKVRKFALMRVEHGGEYALVASKGGAPEHPAWYHNLVADPRITLQDGPAPRDFTVELLDGDDRETWWERAVAVYPPYDEYRDKTERRIPVFVARPDPA